MLDLNYKDMRDFKFFKGFYDGDLTFYTNGGVERMRITSNGFVGIGNINPSYRLDIQGTSSNSFKFFSK